MAAATMTNSWAHAVPLDETTGYPPPPRAESMRSSDSRPTSQHRRLSARRRSDFHLPSDAEPAAAVRASSRASNMRKRSRNALREEDGSNNSKQHPRSRAEESAWIHRDKLAEIEIREMEEAGIHVRQSRRSESRGPADRRQERGSSRSMSRSELYRRGSRDRGEEREDAGEEGEEPTLSPHYASFDEFSRRKRVSTIPAVEDEEEAEAEERDADKQRPFDHNLDSDFRTPEEIEAERAAHRQRITRPSTSRLPVSKVSPVPVPQTVIGRDSPLPRSRNGSGAWSGHWDDQHYARRARSGSVGSQVMLDDPAADTAAAAAATYPTYSSSSRPTSSHLHGGANETSQPRKARVPTKPLPTSGGSRKVSTTTTTNPSSGLGPSRPGSSSAKPRQLSTSTNRGPRPASSHKKTSPTPGRRPSSSHNNNNTYNRPEGEAPWIASMYKPDPRLPQDQQMLPTHAKRMMLAQQQQQQQEQAKAGGAASEVDGTGVLSSPPPPPAGAMWINEKGKWTDTEPSSSLSRPSQQRQGSGKAGTAGGGGGGAEGGRAWPLSPPGGGNSQTSPPPLKTPGSGAGGYRITPTISPPAQIISRKNSGKKDETNGIPNFGDGGGGERSPQQPSQQHPQQRYEGGEGEEEEEKGSDPTNKPNPNATPLNATPRISPPPPAGFAAATTTTTMTGNTARVTAGGRGGGGVGTGEKKSAEEEGEEGSMKKQKGKGGCLGCCVVM
ncbi:hypothetical protein KC347_g3023 [Hortaea werneckii]|nr:hypothetical protein KC347_g3023 [Hortaea werneckii]